MCKKLKSFEICFIGYDCMHLFHNVKFIIPWCNCFNGHILPLIVQAHKVEPFLSALYEHSIPEVNNMDQQAPVISILPRASLAHVCITALCVCMQPCGVRGCVERCGVCTYVCACVLMGGNDAWRHEFKIIALDLIEVFLSCSFLKWAL